MRGSLIDRRMRLAFAIHHRQRTAAAHRADDWSAYATFVALCTHLAARHAEDLAERLEHLLLLGADELSAHAQEAAFLGGQRCTLRGDPHPLSVVVYVLRSGLLDEQRVDRAQLAEDRVERVPAVRVEAGQRVLASLRLGRDVTGKGLD